MHRFLWMVFRSVCSPRRKQKVEIQIARQTREMTMPTQVMTDSSSSLMRPWYCGKEQGVYLAPLVLHVARAQLRCQLRARPWATSTTGAAHLAFCPPGQLAGPHPSAGGTLTSSCSGRLMER